MRIIFSIIVLLLPVFNVCCQQKGSSKPVFFGQLGQVGRETITYVDADAQSFINAAGITDATQQLAVNRLVLDLKGVSNPNYFTLNVWSKLKGLYPFVGGTAASHKWNLKNPVDADTAYRLTFTGTVIHDANGITGNSSGYADTHFLADSIYSANQYSMGEYLRTSDNNFNCGYFSSSGSGNFVSFYKSTTNLSAVFLGAAYGPSSQGYGPAVLSWDGSSAVFAVLSSLSAPKTPNSVSLLNGMGNLVLLGYRASGSTTVAYTSCNISFFFFGNYLSPVEALAVSNAFTQCQVTLGRSVRF
jgi:hypothetical protein